MSETVKFWLIALYEKEIEDAKVTISNEHMFELGYDGDSPNPHTQNIEQLREYLKVLEEKIEELNEK